MPTLPDHLEMHGEISASPKKFGKLNDAQMKAWVLGKINVHERVLGSVVGQALSDFTSAKGKATPWKSENKEVWHCSAGKAGTDKTCTLFFTNPEGNVGKIVAVGQHVTATTYTILWTADDRALRNGATVTLT
jgi:hypothetical protein